MSSQRLNAPVRYTDDPVAYRRWWQQQGTCARCGGPCRRGNPGARCRRCFGIERSEEQSRPEAIERRFWANVEVPLSPSSCWLWTGTRTRQGYGTMSVKDTPRRAHRIAWEMVNGEIPDGIVIDHLCRERGCVNPLHMELVTAGENVLRGNAPPARWARETHCANGHPLSGDNLRSGTRNGKPIRVCRTCVRESERIRRARKRASAA